MLHNTEIGRYQSPSCKHPTVLSLQLTVMALATPALPIATPEDSLLALKWGLASVLNAKRGFSVNSQQLMGEAPGGAAASHSSTWLMWFHLSVNPFTADRLKIRIPDKSLGKEGSTRSHMCLHQI